MPKVILYAKVGALPNMKAALILALITVHASIGLAENLGTKPQIKNVVLIVSDDLKASVLGCYGDLVCQTPHIDALARSGTVFQRAYCQGTWCAPSRQSFMHSRYQNGGEINLGANFQNQGFYSARVGKIYHMRVPGDIIAGTNGLDIKSTWTERYNSTGQEAHTPGDYACLNLNIFTDELANRQSTKMPHRPYVTVVIDGDGADQPDAKSAAKAIEIINEKSASDTPFFLAVGLVRPHYPMVAPKKYFDLYPWQDIQPPLRIPNDLADIPPMGKAKSTSLKTGIASFPDNQKRMWAGYYASVSFMDDQVGKIISEIDRLGIRDSTAIVFTSDHGYHLGEHDFWLKSNLHEEVTRVPLIIDAPGYRPSVTSSPVELVDLYPTLSSLAAIKTPAEAQGTDLTPILEDPSCRVRETALSINNGYALRGDAWTYIRYTDGSEEFYDMNSDPNQFRNLVNDPSASEGVAEARAALDTRIQQSSLSLKEKKKRKTSD
ncbi:MAG: sulfatase [Mariniblastus sp.]